MPSKQRLWTFRLSALTLGIAATLLIVFVCDRLVFARWMPTPSLFPPHACFVYKTSEFECVAETNQWGMRDHEIDDAQRPRLRVLAIGDSFTFV